MVIVFETVPCGRCGGEGRLEMFRHVAGGVCARCSGSRVQLSRAGAAAHRAYEKAISERCGKWGYEIEVGDVITTLSQEQPIQSLVPDASGDFSWAVVEVPGRVSRMGISPKRRYVLHMPEEVDRIAREIAATRPGATYKP